MGRAHETTGKKDIAKKKLQKRKDKAEKKEQRQSQSDKGKDLDDMMAYVDENGNLSNTPPDPRKKKEINSEDISLSYSDRAAIEAEPSVKSGSVTFFNKTKGYGFIKENGTQNSYFVHTNDLAEPITDGDKVTFEVQRGSRGMNAVFVKKVK